MEPYPRRGLRADKERPLVWCRRAGPPATLSAPCRPLMGTDTVCMENRPYPRASPFRVSLPWPPRGGLGAGGQGVTDASRQWLEKQPTPATTVAIPIGDGTAGGCAQTRCGPLYGAACIGPNQPCRPPVGPPALRPACGQPRNRDSTKQGCRRQGLSPASLFYHLKYIYI